MNKLINYLTESSDGANDYEIEWFQEDMDLGLDSPSEPMSMDQWFQTVSNQPITLYITPCRPECAY